MTAQQTQTLTDFLLARIAEDEAVAREALAWLRAEQGERWQADDGGVLDGRGDPIAGYAGEDVAPHIARHDPARVLAECEADRRIVEESYREIRSMEGMIEGEFGAYPADHLDTSEKLLRLLALPYADHPDFRPEWTP